MLKQQSNLDSIRLEKNGPGLLNVTSRINGFLKGPGHFGGDHNKASAPFSDLEHFELQHLPSRNQQL